MTRVAIAAVGCGVAAAFALSAKAGKAEPTLRDVLRGNARQRQASMRRDSPHGELAGVGQIAVEYSVQLRKGGVEEAVDPEQHRFRPGDQIRVWIRPFSDAYIYVFFEDDHARRRCLVPQDARAPLLAKHNRPVQLPVDGEVFEFAAGFKGAALVLVACKEANAELAALCQALRRQSGGQAAPQLRDEKPLATIRERQAQAVSYRGRLSNRVLSRVWTEVEKRDAADAVLLEPPGNGQAATLAMLITRTRRSPALMVRIPLHAAEAVTVNVPWSKRR